MPRGTILEKLTFGDVLESADQIIAHADALKVRTIFCFLVMWCTRFHALSFNGRLVDSVVMIPVRKSSLIDPLK